MADGTCSVDECERDAWCKGWCQMHYTRNLRHGDPESKLVLGWPENLTSRLRFTPAGCIEFTGGVDSLGYGSVNRPDGSGLAHVAMYELIVGPVPEGHHLHHRCENPPCVRPSHLVPLTPLEHRLVHAGTHCGKGHEFTPENTYVWKGRPHARQCRACRAIRRGLSPDRFLRSVTD